MKITKKEQTFLKKNKVVIEKLLEKRLNDLKDLIVDEEDMEKRQRLIDITREMKKWQQIMAQIKNKPKGKEFTGV